MSSHLFLGRSIQYSFVAGFLLLTFSSLEASQTASTPIKPTNTCRPLNLDSRQDGNYREAFSAITPLVKHDGQVQKSSCAAIFDRVKNPDPERLAYLPEYQQNLNLFFSNYCYRDVANGWKHDIQLRDTGPYIQQIINGEWHGAEYGTHNAVVIWYSPEFYRFVQKRDDGVTGLEMPRGAMAVKEMYTPPSSDCKGEDPIDFKPSSEHGAAFIVRQEEISMDGWYWGYFGWNSYPKEVGDLNDRVQVGQYFEDLADNLAHNQSWQTSDGIPGTAPRISYGPGVGWGAECLDCHASAESFQTFADLNNISGERPITSFLSMNFPTTADPAVTKHSADAQVRTQPSAVTTVALYKDAFLETFNPAGIFTGRFTTDAETNIVYDGTPPSRSTFSPMPSASFDSVWVKPNAAHKEAGIASQYVTSDQCFGCHDVGQTGLLFDMSTNVPASNGQTGKFIDQSPYGTWRTSPMGLAGRDPIFFAQLASETQTFHKASPGLVENVCLGCHGIQGQRQYTLDRANGDIGECGEFTRSMVNEIPVANNGMPPGKHANYGALARDGISCTSCHHAIFKESDIAKQFPDGSPDAQNKCVVERQEFLNPGVGHATLAATFTGSFLVGDPESIAAQIENPQVKPMQNALGLTPHQDESFSRSDICGSCHTVHLPILHSANNEPEHAVVGTVFEQTTYPEWAFSEYRTGKTANYPDGTGTLPSGAPSAGKLQISCQRCHMENSDSISRDGFPEGLLFPDMNPENRYVSKIATIQEKTNFPEAAYTLPAGDIDLERREGFARHTLVGLNVFFMSMAKQFPDVLGIPTDAGGYMSADPTGATINVPFIDRTLTRMQGSATTKTATIAVNSAEINEGVLDVEVEVISGVAHKFPSGVGFRRAFVELKVLDEYGQTLWGSGVTNGAGVILDNGAKPDTANPIDGELWWDEQCHPVVDRLAYQPHFSDGAKAISKQSQAQIYQELVMAPPPGLYIKPEVPGQDPVKTPGQPVDMCGTQLGPQDNKHVVYKDWSLTTSFLSICAQAKDNRLLPQGYLPLEDRMAISRSFTINPDGTAGKYAEFMAKKLAMESGSWGVGDDPDYNAADGKPYGGGDTFSYAIPMGDISGMPARITAGIYYQAIPPFYLQDRFCTAKGSDRDRLYYLAGKINLDNLAKDWKLPIASSGLAVSISR